MMRARASTAPDHGSAVSAASDPIPAKQRRSKLSPIKPSPVKSSAEKPCFVYVLGSHHKGRHISYVGWTNDVARRLAQHNNGTGARSTRGRVWIMLHTEAFETRVEAMSREWHLKRDRAFRKKLLDAARSKPVIASEAKQSRTSTSKTGLRRRVRSSQ